MNLITQKVGLDPGEGHPGQLAHQEELLINGRWGKLMASQRHEITNGTVTQDREICRADTPIRDGAKEIQWFSQTLS